LQFNVRDTLLYFVYLHQLRFLNIKKIIFRFKLAAYVGGQMWKIASGYTALGRWLLLSRSPRPVATFALAPATPKLW